jgi:hypothetical protein
MAKQQQGTNNENRIVIPYWDGINAAVQPSLGKITELSHGENARAPLIGVLEKRQGQQKVGTATNGTPFTTVANYGLSSLELTDDTYQGVFRISATQTSPVSPGASTSVSGIYEFTISDTILVSEPDFFIREFDGTTIIDGTSFDSSIYSLTANGTWEELSDTSAQNIIGSNFDFTVVDGFLVMVNGQDNNRMISPNGVTVTDSTEVGSLFNSPRAKNVSYYKSRIYLANFISNGIKYGTTVLRSSYPVGLISLVNGDVTASATVEVTETKYFYTDSGMNQYDIYRGSTKVYGDLTLTTINETSVVFSAPVTLLSSDEIWISGTYSGAKQYRWVNNPSSTGRDVKQYDTFKLSGGEEDEITLFDTIGNILLIGNKSTLLTWNDYTLQNFDLGIGCSSPNGSVKLLGTLYFLHYSGVYSTTGTAPVLVSRKVERYIRGATKPGIEFAAAGFKGTSIFFSIGDVTLYNADGSFWKIIPDTCLEYNVLDQKWYVHTNVPAEMFLNFINSAGTEQLLIEHGDTGHYIKEFLVGNTDDGEEIFFRIDSNEIQFMKEIEYSVILKTVVTHMHRGALVTTMISLDGEDFYEIEGTNKKGITPLKITPRDKSQIQPVYCKKLQLSFRESSKQLCRIVQAAIVYIPTSLNTPEE